VVVELIGGEEPARSLIERALAGGKHVVTANKLVMAKHGRRLSELARTSGVSISMEAAVGAGIPVLRMLELDLAANSIRSLAAVINGTTNYILDRMGEERAGQAEVLARLESFHKAQPLLPAMELPALRDAMRVGAEVLDAALARMGKAAHVEGAAVRLAGHQVKAQGAEGRKLQSLAETYRIGGLTPPDPPAAFATAAMTPGEGERLLALLVKQAILVKAADGIYFHAAPLAAAREKVLAACRAKGELPTPEARQVFEGVTRKHLIPLLEQFDREGLTRRVGNTRYLRAVQKKA